MKYIDLKPQLNMNGVDNCYFLYGNDSYFVKEAEKAIISSCGLTLPELNLASFKEDEYKDFFNCLNSAPLMDKFRVCVFNATDLDDDLVDDFYKQFKNYLKNPNPQSVLIVLAPRLEKLDSITFVDCNKADSSILTKWVTVFFKKKNIAISPDVPFEIIKRCNENMSEIHKLCEILSAFKLDEKSVDIRDINFFKTENFEEEIFTLINFISKKNAKEAIAFYERMRVGKVEDTKIIALLYSSFRRMFFCLVSNQDNDTLASILKVKPYAVKMASSNAKLFSKSKLKRAIELISSSEDKIKTGKITAVDSAYNLVLTLLNL